MHAYTIYTRTMPPTDTTDKRVSLDTEEGTHVVYPWDHAYDAPEVHENAALKVAEMENPGRQVTVQRTGSSALGYTFRATVS